MCHELEEVIAFRYLLPQAEIQRAIISREPFHRYRMIWLLTMIQKYWLPVREDLMPSLVEK